LSKKKKKKKKKKTKILSQNKMKKGWGGILVVTGSFPSVG
jgi:hypothetical protein